MKNDELTELREQRTWTCRIGTFAPGSLPIGADLPMRQAVQKAFHDLLGIHPAATFSGWGDKFDEHEMAVIEDRLPEPEPDTITALQAEVARLREEKDAATQEAERRIVEWLQKEAMLCDCFAREESDCACGAWDGYKQVAISTIIDAIEAGAHHDN